MLIDWSLVILMSLRLLYGPFTHFQTLFQKTKLHQKHVDIILTIVYLSALHYLTSYHDLHNT